MVQFWFNDKAPMKSLTIHNMEQDLARAIEQMAASRGISQNRVVKLLLRQALHLGDPQPARRDVSDFFGIWSEEEVNEFQAATDFFDTIDEELWQ
jgi:hypothetical protein